MRVRWQIITSIPRTLEGLDRDVRPVLLEVFENEATVAELGGVLTAEEDGGLGKDGTVERALDLSIGHQVKEPLLVVGPLAAVLLVSVEHLLRWREKGLVDVLRVA